MSIQDGILKALSESGIFFRVFLLSVFFCICLSLFKIDSLFRIDSLVDSGNGTAASLSSASPGAIAARSITIGVGRDFYDGSDSRSFLHGSTNTWEGLTYLDQNLKAIPCIAESWNSSDDAKRWTFYIRENVHFHDGTVLTNRDVVSSIQRIISNPRYDIAGNYRSVVSLETQGERSVVFVLKEPIPYFPNLTAYYSSPVIKPSSIESDGTIKSFIATGPYKPVKIARGDRIELEAFDRYWGKKPLYSNVIFKTVPDAQSRLMALISKEIDAVADVGAILPEQASLIGINSDLILKSVQVATTHLLLFNCSNPPFSDIDNRLWFAGAFDRSGLIDVFAKDASIEACDPYTQLLKDFSFCLIHPQQKPFLPFSYDKPLKILLGSSTLQRWPYSEMAQIIQQMLKSRGILSEINTKELGAYHDSIKQGDFSIAIQPYTLMSGDPDFFYSYWIASDAPKNCGWKNTEADALIKKARHDINFENRQAHYKRLEQMMNDNLPLLPIYHDVSLYACSREFKDFEMDCMFRPVLTKAVP